MLAGKGFPSQYGCNDFYVSETGSHRYFSIEKSLQFDYSWNKPNSHRYFHVSVNEKEGMNFVGSVIN